MLGSEDAVATVAVKNIEAAKAFYENTLGLKSIPTGQDGVLSYKSGISSILVYQSEFARTNKATAITWVVKQVDEIVKHLKSRGVTFERYDMPGSKLQGDVYVSGDMKNAWFKDPDGNILAIVGDA